MGGAIVKVAHVSRNQAPVRAVTSRGRRQITKSAASRVTSCAPREISRIIRVGARQWSRLAGSRRSTSVATVPARSTTTGIATPRSRMVLSHIRDSAPGILTWLNAMIRSPTRNPARSAGESALTLETRTPGASSACSAVKPGFSGRTKSQ